MSSQRSRYEVRRNAELAARALREARTDLERWLDRLRSVEARVELAIQTHGHDGFPVPVRLSRPGRNAGIDEIRAASRQAQALQLDMSDALEARLVELDLAETLGAFATTQPAAELRRFSTETSGAGPSDEARGQEALSVLDRLDAAVSAEDRRRLYTLAQDVATAHSAARRDAGRDELRLRVQEANASASAIRAEGVEATSLIEDLAGLTGPEVDEVRVELRRVEDRVSRLTSALRARAGATVEGARRRADREYALKVITLTLRELGYEIEPDFETLVVRDGVAHVVHSSLQGYGVRLRVDEAAGTVNFNVVRTSNRTAGDQALRDHEVEQAWCNDYAKLVERAHSSGVVLEVEHQRDAGALPVQVVDEDFLALPRSTKTIEPRRRAVDG